MDARHWISQFNNCEQYLDEVEKPLIELGKIVSNWRKDYQANELSLSQLYLIFPVLEALMKLPAETRQDLCGQDLEELHQVISQKFEQ